MEQKKMNMISTGAFLNEMDASNKQETVAEKFARVWEKKNAKAARAGGVSLMALSLAACGSSSDDTDTDNSASSGNDSAAAAPTAENKALSASSVTGTYDAVTTGAAGDTISGSVTMSDANPSVVTGTFEAADTINGGDGSDTLSITVGGGGATYVTGALPAADVSNVETLSVRSVLNAAADILTVNLANYASVTAFNANVSTNRIDLSGAVATDTITMTGNGSATNGAFNVTYTATTTSSTINIDGDTTGGAVSVTGGAITAQTITSTGGTNVLASFTGAATTEDYTINATTNLDLGTGIANVAAATGNTITVSGAATTVDLGSNAMDADIDVVDASGLTAGGIVATMNSTTAQLTGGGGDDTINIGTLALTKAVAAGDGSDTLIVTDDTNWSTQAGKVSGFETLTLGGSGATYDLGLVTGETTIKTDSGGAIAFTNFVEGTGLTVVNDVTTSVGVTLTDVSGQANSLTVTIDDEDTTAAAITVGAINAAGVETINIVTGDAMATGTAHVVSALTSSTSAKTVNVSGTSDLTITDISALAASATVDASSWDKRLIVNEIDAGDTIKGGSGNDTVSTAYADFGTTTAIQLGAGDDTINVEGNGSDIVDADFAQVSGVENLTLGSTTTTSVTLAGYAQNAIGTVTGNLDITTAILTTGGTIDAGALVSQGVDVVAKLNVASSVNGTATLAITGSAVNDTISATLDSTADSGDDVTATNINGGNGIDTITYALSNTGTDVLTITSTATTAANADIITGFASATDKFDYNGLGATANGTATTDDANATFAGGIANNAAAGTYIITTNIADSGSNLSGTTMTTLLASSATTLAANYDAFEAQLVASGGIFASTIAGLDAALTSGQTALISVDNGVGSVLMKFTNSTATGNTVTAAELDLVAVFTDTATLATGDVI